MKVLNDNKSDTNSPPTYSFMALGLFLLGYVGYCITLSSSECVYFFGKSGLLKDCTETRNWGYGSLAVASLIGVGFLALGINNLKKRKA
jgi:hypothetical protein